VTEKGVILPKKAEKMGDATNEQILLKPGVGFATIPHTGGRLKYMQDAIVLHF